MAEYAIKTGRPSSSQAAHLSLPAKAESSVIPLLLLSHEVQNALRGFPGPMEVGAELRFRKLPIFCSRPRPRAQSFRCSSSPTKCRMHFVGSRGRWRLELSFVFASCPSFAPGQGRELSHSAVPPPPRSAECTSWVPGADGDRRLTRRRNYHSPFRAHRARNSARLFRQAEQAAFRRPVWRIFRLCF